MRNSVLQFPIWVMVFWIAASVPVDEELTAVTSRSLLRVMQPGRLANILAGVCLMLSVMVFSSYLYSFLLMKSHTQQNSLRQLTSYNYHHQLANVVKAIDYSY